ncbi:MAG TPA: undecaprenyl-diphosphatase UppP [Kofleriaceae bacterium]|nr:undecaprenyl-diphosphatase UppP [Kofleriaceae bacterium]
MHTWFAIVLGALQGVSEFLPISSTAHLRLAPALLGQHDPGAAFTAVLQLGTLLAVLIYFARDLFVELPRALVTAPHTQRGRLPLYLVAGTIPIVIAGVAGKSIWVGDARSLWVVAGALVAVAFVILAVDRGPDGSRTIDDLALRDVLWIGLAQALALVPGVSRSGSTICAALVLGMRRSEAARFSFLLGVPAIAGAGLLELPDALRQLGGYFTVVTANHAPAIAYVAGSGRSAIVVGTVTAAVVGYASIAWLLRYLGRHGLRSFASYRIALGVIVIALLVAGVIEPFAGT